MEFHQEKYKQKHTKETIKTAYMIAIPISLHPKGVNMLDKRKLEQNTYRKVSNIRRTKSQNLNASRLIL